MNATRSSRPFASAVLILALTVPASWACVSPRRTVLVRVPPPAARVEVRPARPGPGHVWVAGHWRWSGRRYVWASGHWARPPHAGAVWAAGHWARRGGGWLWVAGHWKR
ncbi:MAG: YXWGXW repeat-containing protein [Acidobacteria bacterium]|nr:YXWGXW repeat-containing protein [Acidobacteriota bacterium]